MEAEHETHLRSSSADNYNCETRHSDDADNGNASAELPLTDVLQSNRRGLKGLAYRLPVSYILPTQPQQIPLSYVPAIRMPSVSAPDETESRELELSKMQPNLKYLSRSWNGGAEYEVSEFKHFWTAAAVPNPDTSA